ncbi:hypothetical protein HS088_TW12G01013 [Tripterygium wilfordii]|uniref:Phosphoglycerate mutase-like protein 1 n=1 Tax=Tripterygium wilfordii TaxID=458696 RepID=A0A7J7D0A8_TRIWF|nr:hypothetical protein HS088_TW12G01013 [Tripterygium wilfordii]
MRSGAQVRHAQGVHNIEAEKDHDALLSPTLFDAQLSPLGWQQVSRLREQVLESGLSKRIELVVTSPLLRTMQTAVGVFGGKSQTEGLDLPPLMEANVGNSGLPAISSSDCPPFIAVELCRERWGRYPCDKRRSVSESKLLFPAIDFSLAKSDEDNLWEADVVESSEDLIDRGMKFLSWLRTRKETEIAVVSHSIFLNQMLNALGKDCHPSVKDEICKNMSTPANAELSANPTKSVCVRFGNGELRSLVLFDKRNPTNTERKRKKTAAMTLILVDFPVFSMLSEMVGSTLSFSEDNLRDEEMGIATSQKDLAFNEVASTSGSKIVEASVGGSMDINSTQ